MPNTTHDRVHHHAHQDQHPHTNRCWWNHEQARWVCSRTTEAGK